MISQKVTIRPEERRDYKSIVSLILRSFREGTNYSDGTDIVALVEEIRDSQTGPGRGPREGDPRQAEADRTQEPGEEAGEASSP